MVPLFWRTLRMAGEHDDFRKCPFHLDSHCVCDPKNQSEHHKWVILSPAGLGSYQGAQVILQQSSDFLHFVCIYNWQVLNPHPVAHLLVI